MAHVSLAEAKSQLSALVARAERGETITITRRGKTVATLNPAEPQRQPIDVEALRAATAQIRPQPSGAGDFVRAMRDSDRF
ncbi:MAG: type II toxin-antitoxin system prevent-host-death family antitoxin [Alphaproteobacteria bacterium]|nr:type II toxin-antitoxin system prevent-host-death family antitoxin [Alphaproteobacteria bacterium]